MKVACKIIFSCKRFDEINNQCNLSYKNNFSTFSCKQKFYFITLNIFTLDVYRYIEFDRKENVHKRLLFRYWSRIDCLLRENYGRYIRGLESPRSRSVTISWIAGREERSVVLAEEFSTAAMILRLRQSRLVTQHEQLRANALHTASERSRDRRTGERRKRRRREIDGGNWRGEEQDYKRRLYGRTLIPGLIEISISRVNAPRGDTSVHNSS